MSRNQNGSHLGNIITVVVSFAAVLVFAAVGFTFMYKTIKTSETLRADQTRVHQENLIRITKKDEDTGKILLSQDYLAEEYRYYHEGLMTGQQTFHTILTAIILVIVGICLISAVIQILKSVYRGERISLLRVVISLVPIVFVVGFYFVSSGKMVTVTKPEPDKAIYQIYLINVLRKQAITTTDSDGDTHTQYKIYFENASGGQQEMTVTSKMFEDIWESRLPSEHFLVQAKDGADSKYFAIYSLEDYQFNR